MKKSAIIICILLIIVIAGILYFVYFNKNSIKNYSSNQLIQVKNGKYFDVSNNQIELGNCKSEYNKTEFVTTEYFYRSDGNLIGNCWSYSGPGGSGAKYGCNSEELLNPLCEGSGCGQLEGRRTPKYYCKTD